jgi:dTDP-4-amino-4,6-dideoxygalactose transaminase
VDFLPNSTNVDIDHLAELIDSDTAGVMVTHYHVSQKDMAAIGDLCRQRGVALFDDCAISIGASYNGCPIGSLTDGSVFSFSGFKVLNYYWGGALAVPPGKTADALEQEVLSWPRLSTRLYLPQIRKVALYAAVTGPALFPLVFRLRRRVIGPGKIVDIFPLSRVETVQLDDTIRSRPANVALCEWVRKLETVRSVIDHRRGIAAIYDRYFREINVSAETPESIRQESAFVNYPIVVGEERRDTIYRAALSANFDVGLSLYPNAHEMPSLSGTEGRTNRISKLVRSIVTLPTHTRATPEYSERLAKFMSGLLTAGQGRG